MAHYRESVSLKDMGFFEARKLLKEYKLGGHQKGRYKFTNRKLLGIAVLREINSGAYERFTVKNLRHSIYSSAGVQPEARTLKSIVDKLECLKNSGRNAATGADYIYDSSVLEKELDHLLEFPTVLEELASKHKIKPFENMTEFDGIILTKGEEYKKKLTDFASDVASEYYISPTEGIEIYRMLNIRASYDTTSKYFK